MTTNQVAAFLRQPSTVLGIATVLGTISSILTGQMTLMGAIPPLVGAAYAIIVRDNTTQAAAQQKQVEAATQAVVAAAEAAAASGKAVTIAATPTLASTKG